MARRKTPESTETSVLLSSRRRCCFCFGLDRDLNIKAGQIAHLDRDNTNNAEDNLAFLCLEHHDQYDSKTSQRKGFTVQEAKAFRAELIAALGTALSQKVHFGVLELPPGDPRAGHYIRVGAGQHSAEISLTPLPDSPIGTGRYFLSGYAEWGAWREYGPNQGSCDYVIELGEADHVIHHGEGAHELRLSFADDILIVNEEHYEMLYGANVTLAGTYRRVR